MNAATLGALSPQDAIAVESVIERVRRTYGGWRRDTPPDRMRADWDALFPSADVSARIEPVQIGDLHAEWAIADGAAHGPALLHLHGGGFRVGSCASHRELMAGLSAASGCRVLGLDYRLAPEHRHPAPQQDTRAAWNWLLAQGEPPTRLAVVGDSVGALLALGLLLQLRDEAEPLPVAAVTLSALTDLSASGSSYETRAADDPMHQRAFIQGIARVLLGDGDPRDPAVSPRFADLAGLPPLLMQVGDRETVLSDTTDVAERARAAGVDVTVQVWPGMVHVFQQFAGELVAAREARAAIGTFLRRHLPAASKPQTTSAREPGASA